MAKFPVVYLIPLTMLRKDICQLFGCSVCYVQINVVHLETGDTGRLRELNVDCPAGFGIPVSQGWRSSLYFVGLTRHQEKVK